eukprot:Nk52_evm5s324 gene=Nk52_evmTU5s324
MGEQKLRRVLSRRQLMQYMISSTLGSGAYISLGLMANRVSVYVVLPIFLAALNAFLAGMSYAEFASTYPTIGSAFSVIYTTLGELPGWFCAWLILGSWLCTAGLIAALFSNYLAGVVELLLVQEEDYDPNTGLYNVDGLSWWVTGLEVKWWIIELNITPVSLMASVPAGLLCFISMQRISKVVAAGAVLNVLVLGLFVISGLFYMDYGDYREAWSMWHVMGHDFNNIVDATVEGVFAFIGVEVISMLASEAVNPRKDIPLATMVAIPVVMIVYMVIGVVASGMFAGQIIKYNNDNSTSAATEFMNMDDIGPTLLVNLWEYDSRPVAFGVIFGLGACGCLFILCMCSITNFSRVCFSLAMDGLLPGQFRILTKRKVPKLAVIVGTGGAAFLGLLFPMVGLLKIVTPTALLGYSLTSVGLISHRMQFPLNIYHFKRGGFHSNYFILPLLLLWFMMGSLAFFSLFLRSGDVHIYDHVIMAVGAILLFGIPGLIVLGLYIKNRKSYRKLNSTFKVPFFPVLPLLSILFNTFLMSNIPFNNFAVVLLWSVMGLLIYFVYGIRSSNLNFVHTEYSLGAGSFDRARDSGIFRGSHSEHGSSSIAGGRASSYDSSYNSSAITTTTIAKSPGLPRPLEAEEDALSVDSDSAIGLVRRVPFSDGEGASCVTGSGSKIKSSPLRAGQNRDMGSGTGNSSKNNAPGVTWQRSVTWDETTEDAGASSFTSMSSMAETEDSIYERGRQGHFNMAGNDVSMLRTIAEHHEVAGVEHIQMGPLTRSSTRRRSSAPSAAFPAQANQSGLTVPHGASERKSSNPKKETKE